MFCPNCGTQNPETATACSKCGFNVKGAAAPKFKGTMLMMNAPGAAKPGAPAAPPATPPPAAPAAPHAAPKGFKGTMVGVAPPMAMQHTAPAPAAPPPAAPAAPPAAPGGFGAPQQPPQDFGAPPQTPGGFGAPPAAPEAPPGFGPPGGAPAGAGVNPLGGTVAVDQVPGGFGGGFGAPPPAPPPPAPLGAPGGFGAPPPEQAYGAPPPQQGYGAPPPQQSYGGPPQQGYGAPPAQGFGAPPPQQGYGAPMGGPMMQVGAPMQPGYGPAGGAGPVGTVRNPVTTLLFSMLCFIYGLVAMVGMINELRAFTRNDKIAWWPLFVPFYNLVYFYFMLPGYILEAKHMAGVQNPTVGGLLYLIPVYGYFLFVNDVNEVWTTANPQLAQ